MALEEPMSTTKETPSAIPPELMADLEEACADAMTGIRRPEKMEEAARELDEGREEIRRRVGETRLAERLTDRDDE
jgi:hypothetical protein